MNQIIESMKSRKETNANKKQQIKVMRNKNENSTEIVKDAIYFQKNKKIHKRKTDT